MKEKKLSKIDRNKKLLHEMQSSDDQETPIEVKEIKRKLLVREFKCDCGFSVRLEGDFAKDMSINKCSVCRSKK